MKLYFSPLACSLAARIALYEARADAHFEEVDTKAQLTLKGRDYREIHPLGLVPVLELPNGELLRENAAVLQYIARAHPEAELAPTDPLGIARLQQWLSFVGTELHKGLFAPLLSKTAGPEVRSFALSLGQPRLAWVAQHLQGREFLLDRFTVADAYLFTILNWTVAAPVDLKRWPALVDYRARLARRPSVERAFHEELALYRAQQARREKNAGAPPLSTADVIERFNTAFLRHDPSLLEDLIDDECVLENSTPAPLGARHVGRQECLELWRGIAQNRDAHFELEDVEISGERAHIRWRYYWGSGASDSLRGVNLMRVRNGRVVEARGYVKGA